MFDLSNVTPSGSFEVLPAGKYNASCTNAELKETANGKGKYIKIELTITDGKFEGRKLWTNFNVVNENQKAKEIGLGQLKNFLLNAGYPNPDILGSVTELNGLRVGVKTKIRSDEQYGDKAEVSYFTKVAPQSDTLAQELPTF
jgi:hypothetical protein